MPHRVADAGTECDHVHFLSVDLQTRDAFEQLIAAGFDPSKRMLFPWEGATLHLTEHDVRKTRKDVHTYTPTGSTLLADFCAQRCIGFSGAKTVQKTWNHTGEGLGCGLPFATEHDQVLRDFVVSEHMSLGQAQFMGGSSKNGPFMVVAEMDWNG